MFSSALLSSRMVKIPFPPSTDVCLIQPGKVFSEAHLVVLVQQFPRRGDLPGFAEEAVNDQSWKNRLKGPPTSRFARPSSRKDPPSGYGPVGSAQWP